MGRSAKLMNFERGQMIGVLQVQKSVRDISTFLNIPRHCFWCDSEVETWRDTYNTKAYRPTCLSTDRDCRQLKRVVKCSRETSIQIITQEFQTASGSTPTTMKARRKVRKLGFHGREAAHKPHITQVNAKRCLAWC